VIGIGSEGGTTTTTKERECWSLESSLPPFILFPCDKEAGVVGARQTNKQTNKQANKQTKEGLYI
jgi:hypothetical protein